MWSCARDVNSLRYDGEAGFESLSLNPCLISVQGQSQNMGLAQTFVSFSMFKLCCCTNMGENMGCATLSGAM